MRVPSAGKARSYPQKHRTNVSPATITRNSRRGLHLNGSVVEALLETQMFFRESALNVTWSPRAALNSGRHSTRLQQEKPGLVGIWHLQGESPESSVLNGGEQGVRRHMCI